jgi:hypothetical protein
VALWLLWVALTSATDFDRRFETVSEHWGGAVRLDGRTAVPRPDLEPMQAQLHALLVKEQDRLRQCWSTRGGPDRWLVDLALRPSGRLAALQVDSTARNGLASCLESTLLVLRYPGYAAETADGRSIEAKNLTVPLRFSVR